MEMSGETGAPIKGAKVISCTNVEIIVAAGLTAVLGLMVLVGWHAHAPMLVQVHPTFVPMQYNTELGFLLSGAGLLALAGAVQLEQILVACDPVDDLGQGFTGAEPADGIGNLGSDVRGA